MDLVWLLSGSITGFFYRTDSGKAVTTNGPDLTEMLFLIIIMKKNLSSAPNCWFVRVTELFLRILKRVLHH